jgi:thiol:disulfide interchange protein DsbD
LRHNFIPLSILEKIRIIVLSALRHFSICLMLVAFAYAEAQQPSTAHARVELLSQRDSITPQSNLLVGIHFLLEPGWHIYWINPGDSGQPPSLKWQLPAGFSAGEIQWSRPDRMQTNAQLADYGYHGDVLLPVTIHVPASAKNSSPIQIAADAKWLVCREVCIPEHARLQIALPVSTSPQTNPATAQLFAVAEKRVPKALPRGWKTIATSTKDSFVLTIVSGKRIAKAEFFPLDPDQIDNPSSQKLAASATGASLTLKKSDQLLKPITALRGVLVLADGTAYTIEAPVHQSLQ